MLIFLLKTLIVGTHNLYVGKNVYRYKPHFHYIKVRVEGGIHITSLFFPMNVVLDQFRDLSSLPWKYHGKPTGISCLV